MAINQLIKGYEYVPEVLNTCQGTVQLSIKYVLETICFFKTKLILAVFC